MKTALFLHGLASSPGSSKATWLRPRFAASGWQFIVPDLNVPSFEEMRISAQVVRIRETMAQAGVSQAVLVGSSLGALSTLVLAAESPGLVSHVVLLAPALDFVATHLARLAGSTPEEWRQKGSLRLLHYDGKPHQLGYQLAEDASQFDFCRLALQRPCLIMHGTDDEVVPFSHSVAFAAQRHNVTLLPIEGGQHSLLPEMPSIWSALSRFVGITPGAI
jgi:pimeloyl-ACP methyl ester carboxylesterase